MKNKKINDKLYDNLTSFEACSIVEGFTSATVTVQDLYTAWQWIYDTGLYKELQGWYGRQVNYLLKIGAIIK